MTEGLALISVQRSDWFETSFKRDSAILFLSPEDCSSLYIAEQLLTNHALLLQCSLRCFLGDALCVKKTAKCY